MPKFKSKPVVIDAVQYTHDMDFDTRYALLNLLEKSGSASEIYADCVIVKTTWDGEPSGVIKLVEGDWLVKGVKGEIYAQKPDVFEMSYEQLGSEKKQDTESAGTNI